MSKIKNFTELYEALLPYRAGRWVFRGLGHPSYTLVPKVGRSKNHLKAETRIFDRFVKESTAHNAPLHNNLWEHLATAQHYGLPTRLMDWSENPLVACYFACNEHYNEDAFIYALATSNIVDTETIQSPFDVEECYRYKPRFVNERLVAQKGLFTVHPEPGVSLVELASNQLNLEKLVICKTYKETLRWDLSRFDINDSSLFPGLDGLCSHINWIFEDADPLRH